MICIKNDEIEKLYNAYNVKNIRSQFIRTSLNSGEINNKLNVEYPVSNKNIDMYFYIDIDDK